MNLNKKDCLLTFEWDAKNELLEIHGNQDGLKKLRDKINSLIDNTQNNSDHIHLMTEDWGGEELSNSKQNKDNQLIHHVKIFNWTDL